MSKVINLAVSGVTRHNEELVYEAFCDGGYMGQQVDRDGDVMTLIVPVEDRFFKEEMVHISITMKRLATEGFSFSFKI